MIKIKTKEQLDEVIKQDKISIIKIGTEWCFNCRSIQRQIESQELNYPDFSYYLIDLDELDVEDEYKVEDLPTVIAFKNGKEISRKNDAELLDWLKFLSLSW